MNIGDIVKIRLHPHGFCGKPQCTRVTCDMFRWDGKEAIVTEASNKRYHLNIDGGKWGWADCMLEPQKVPDLAVMWGESFWSYTSPRYDMKDFEKTYRYFSIGSEPNYFASLFKKSMDTLKQVPNTLKRFVKGAFRSFYQLGWVDQDLDLTERGGRALTLFLFEHFEKEFGEYAAKKVAELKKKEEDEESDE